MPQASSTPSPTSGGLTRVEDRQAGFSVQYPSAWQQLPTADPGMQLRVGPNQQTSASVRVISYVSPMDAAGRQALVNEELKSVSVVEESGVSVHGVTGWQVVYGVLAPAGPAVHIHVFLFEPARIHTIVFETPQTSLRQYARAFDLIRDSYQVLPAASPAPPPAATPAPPRP